ncbi:MAG TPA: hypothetical protein VKC66_03300 [Xanthobacteraceae bacterium]|nr:hypothetical protein [Xanthobacteraceae bacterium]
MPKRPSPPTPQPAPPSTWIIHRAAHRLIWMGDIEATDESDALKKGAEQFRVPATKLMAERRR